ncbi:FlxA-like protein [Corchorus capsularis]|uniref:FlxA-like protein n=1 Tax=Corchorus capsularis TaxID=210143 RepID=A0A1R3I6A2_COCAP|nr:FlxA-like protein [Corchorus capsularis]
MCNNSVDDNGKNNGESTKVGSVTVSSPAALNEWSLEIERLSVEIQTLKEQMKTLQQKLDNLVETERRRVEIQALQEQMKRLQQQFDVLEAEHRRDMLLSKCIRAREETLGKTASLFP